MIFDDKYPLTRVPILEGDLVFLGAIIDDDGTTLHFRNDSHRGQVAVFISPEEGGALMYTYKKFDDRLGGLAAVYEGPYGDPMKDRLIPDY